MKNFFANRSLKVDILTKVFVGVFSVVVLIVAYNTYAARNMVLNHTRFFIKQQNEIVLGKVIDYMNISKEAAVTNASLCAHFDLRANYPFFKRHMLAQIKRLDGVASISVLKKDGFFMSTEELDISSLGKSNRSSQEPKTTKFFFKKIDAQAKKQEQNYRAFLSSLSEEIVRETLKDPQQLLHAQLMSPLNQQVFETQKGTWSDVPIATGDHQSFIGYHTPIKTEKGEIVGVVSAETALPSLSLFLNEIRISNKSHLVIINSQKQIVADSDMPDFGKIVRLDDAQNHLLHAALKHVEDHQKKPKEKDKIPFLHHGGEDFFCFTTPFPAQSGLNWKIIFVAPVKDFTEAASEIMKNATLMSGILFFFVLFVLYFQIQRLSDPIVELAMEATKIQSLDLEDSIGLKSSVEEIQQLANAMQHMKMDVSNFSRYIPKALVQKFVMQQEEVSIGGKEFNLVLFFSDVANFTTISEKTDPQALMQHLSEYFEEMTRVILSTDGTIDKFIGDAVMAFWGAPTPTDQACIKACKTALICQQKLYGLNKYWVSLNKPAFNTRIGIHAGTAIVGNLGSSERMNYTAIGDTVNTAARLEGTNKMYGTNVLISEAVLKDLTSDFVVRLVDRVAVKGKSKGIDIYELVGLNNDPYIKSVPLEYQRFCRQFTEAFHLYLDRKWEEAKRLFFVLYEESRRSGKEDMLSQKYMKKCEEFLVSPPSDDWNGTVYLNEK